jgi:small conductance mechanosensitive channel
MNFAFILNILAVKTPSLAKEVAHDTANLKAEVSKIPDALQSLINWSIESGKHILVAILIYYFGRMLIKFINRFVERLLTRRNVEKSVKTFLKSLVNITLTILLLVAVINELGIDTTSFAALLAAAGVAIGMALSGNLQNFAGGIIVLLFKPYKVGDYIDAQGISGVVKEIQVFHTILTTVDNKLVYIPNGPMSSGSVVNYSHSENRMVEWVIGIDYGEDYEKVKGILLSLVSQDARVLSEPAPFVALKALDASSVNVVLRTWTKAENYWPLYFDMNQKVYTTFNAEGIDFPYPQMTVHQAK